MKKNRKITAILLVVMMVLVSSMSGCTGHGPGTNVLTSEIAGEIQSELASELAGEDTSDKEPNLMAELDNNWQKPEGESTSEEPAGQADTQHSSLFPTYEHYDATSFMADCEKLEGLAKDGTIDEISPLYESLLKEFLHINDLYCLADLMTNEDVTDDSLEEEKTYTYDILVEADNAFCTACKRVLEGKNAKDFEAYLNDASVSDYYKTYVELTPELKQILTEEEELEDDYFDAINAYEDATYFYNGTLYRLGDILDDSNFYMSDPDGYMEVYSGCMKAINDEVGAIYVKLVKLRDKKAKIYGYKNYCEYADDMVFNRDYSEADLEQFKKGVKDFGGEFLVYHQYLSQALPDYTQTGEDIVNDARECIKGISPYSDEATQYLADNHLYSIGGEKNRMDGGYTNTFPGKGVPYIYFKTGNGIYDLTSIVHEMGHFTDACHTPNPHPQCGEGSYDLYEVHSTGLQLLAGSRYKDVMRSGGPLVESYQIFTLMTYVSEGCMYDEWEREIYKHPDMTLDEINALYKKVSTEYGAGMDMPGEEYTWMFIHHHFVSPVYYISYATSAFASLQIYLKSVEDFDAGVKTWETFIEESAYDKGYKDVVKDAGLKYFSNSKDVKNVLQESFEQAVAIVMEEEGN